LGEAEMFFGLLRWFALLVDADVENSFFTASDIQVLIRLA
jgi:hypothetical protein